MRRCVCAIIAVLLLSPLALGRGGQRGARRMMNATAHLRLTNVQNVPDLMRFVRHPYDRTLNAISLSNSSVEAPPPILPRSPYAERLPSPAPPEGSTHVRPKLLDSAGDILRCGSSPSSGCLAPPPSYRTYVAY